MQPGAAAAAAAAAAAWVEMLLHVSSNRCKLHDL
jgi:hypothetical protein